MTYCEKCMRPLDGMSVCPVCGRLPAAPLYHLEPGTILQEKYQVGRALSEDSCSITYIARDLSTDSTVAIREYFPMEDARRDSSKSNVVSEMQKHDNAINRFVEKARLLSEFRNEPCVAGVYDYFRQNHTAYMVMEGPGGLSLQTYVQKKGAVPAEALLELMKPLLQTLQQIHRKGLIHRNISPESIRIYGDGSMKLVNFGTVSGAVDENSLKPGYAPVELYGLQGRSGPWSDVYALACSIYMAITGIVPQLSVERAAQDELRSPLQYGVAITEQQEAALMRALAVWPQARTQSVAELMDGLGLIEPEPVPVIEEPAQAEAVFDPSVAEAAPVSEPVQTETPAQAAPRWEPVDDPANWDNMPGATGDILLDPVMLQGRAAAEPVQAAPQQEEQEEFEQLTAWQTLLAQVNEEEPTVGVHEITPEAEPAAPVYETVPEEELTVSIHEPVPVEEPSAPAHEIIPEEEPTVSVHETVPEEELTASVHEIEQAISIHEPAVQAEPIPWEEPVPEWQGDYTPVEPIDPKFWQKELGVAEEEEPMPWDEAPEAWKEPAAHQEKSDIWPGIPETEQPAKKKSGKKLGLILGIAGGAMLLFVAIIVAAVVWLLPMFLKPDPVDLTLTLNGDTLELPCTVEDLVDQGWKGIRLREDALVAAGNVLSIEMEREGVIRVLTNNNGDEDVPLSQCVVTSVMVNDEDVKAAAGTIDLDTTFEQLKEQLGRPAEKEDDTISYLEADGTMWTFAQTEDGALKSITVTAPQPEEG